MRSRSALAVDRSAADSGLRTSSETTTTTENDITCHVCALIINSSGSADRKPTYQLHRKKPSADRVGTYPWRCAAAALRAFIILRARETIRSMVGRRGPLPKEWVAR